MWTSFVITWAKKRPTVVKSFWPNHFVQSCALYGLHLWEAVETPLLFKSITFLLGRFTLGLFLWRLVLVELQVEVSPLTISFAFFYSPNMIRSSQIQWVVQPEIFYASSIRVFLIASSSRCKNVSIPNCLTLIWALGFGCLYLYNLGPLTFFAI